MRVCRAAADGRHGVRDKSQQVFVCLEWGYHGAADAVIDISPYKYRSKGGRGRASNIIEVAIPHSFNDQQQVESVLANLQQSLDQALKENKVICGLFAESVLVSS